jgi:hypothetical protein
MRKFDAHSLVARLGKIDILIWQQVAASQALDLSKKTY